MLLIRISASGVLAEDDVLWDSCKYIRRMMKRLEELPHYCTYEAHLYEHGTHFVFPEGMVRKLIPFGVNLLLPLVFKEAKGYTKECRKTREDIQRDLMDAIRKWQKGSLVIPNPMIRTLKWSGNGFPQIHIQEGW